MNLTSGQINNSLNWRQLIILISLILIGVLFWNLLSFTSQVSFPYIRADGWRHISTYLIPWYEERLNFTDFWSDHHSQPVNATLMILNAELFDLRMDYEAIFGAFFALFSCLLIIRSISLSYNNMPNIYIHLILLLSAAAITLSLTSLPTYYWSLVTVGHISIFFCIGLVCFLDMFTTNNLSKKNIALFSFYSFILLILFSTGAKLYIYAATPILIFRSIIYKKKNDAIALLCIFCVYVIHVMFFKFFDIGGKYSASFDITAYLNNPIAYIKYIGIGVMSIWVNFSEFIKEHNLTSENVENLGLAFFVIYVLSFCMYLQSDLCKKTIMPGAMILVSFLVAIGGAVYRFNPDVQLPWVAGVPRYYVSYYVGAIGVLWVWCYILSGKNHILIKSFLITIVFSGVVYLQDFSNMKAWYMAPYLNNNKGKTIAHMKKNWKTQDFSSVPSLSVPKQGVHYYKTGLEFLNKEQLSIFSQNFPK